MANTVPIRYVGLKDEETDHLYGTWIVWKKGEVHDVPADKAPLLLNHPDMWADARSTVARKKDPIEPAEPPRPRTKDELLPPANLPYMNEEGLRRYAQVHFNEDLPENMPLPEIRLRVQEMIRHKGDL